MPKQISGQLGSAQLGAFGLGWPGPLYVQHVYYVATTGNDSNAGTSGSPFITIQRGVDVAVPGDTIIVKDGTYLPPSATVDAMAVNINKTYLTIRAENPLGAILDGNGTAHSYFNLQANSARIIIDGFEITNTRWGGVWANDGGATECTIENCYIHNIGNRVELSPLGIAGIYTDSGASVLIYNNRFEHIGRDNDAGNSYDHSIYSHGHLDIIDNYFLDTPMGWHIQAAAGFSGLMQGNIFFGPNGYDSKPGQIMLWGAEGDVTIDSNVFYNPRIEAITFFNATFHSLTITNNSVFGITGTVATPPAGAGGTLAGATTMSGNTVAPLGSYGGPFPSGSGVGAQGGSPPSAPVPPAPPAPPGTPPNYAPPGGGGGSGVPGGPSPVDKRIVPLALHTFAFDNTWLSSQNDFGAWSNPQLFFQQSANFMFMETCSAGVLSTDAFPPRRGVIGFSSAAGLVFFGDGLPAQPKLVANPGFDSLDALDYWDISHGAWWYGDRYWLIAKGFPASSSGVITYPMLSTADDGDTWDWEDPSGTASPPVGRHGAFMLRRDENSSLVDVCYLNAGFSSLVLDKFDLASPGWAGPYGALDLGREAHFVPGNGIVRYPNGDVGILYTNGTKNQTSDDGVYYRLYSGAWGPEITVAAPTGVAFQGTSFANLTIDPSGELIHVFYYTLSGRAPSYKTVTHEGVVSGVLHTFPDVSGTDGVGSGMILNNKLYVPYDDFGDTGAGTGNAVWEAPRGTVDFVKKFLPRPLLEAGLTPSCSYLTFGRPVTGGAFPEYVKRKNAPGNG